MRNYPRPDDMYTLQEIETVLYLRDMPSLGFWGPNGQRCVVQNAHFTSEAMLAADNWAKSQWRYVRETEEWIPVFEYAGDLKLLGDLLDFEVELNPYLGKHETHGYWCIPKFAPREQFYTLSLDGLHYSYGDDTYVVDNQYAGAKAAIATYLAQGCNRR